MTLLKKFLLAILAILLIIEEWLWDILTILGAYLARWLHLQKFELWLSAAPPKIALTAFLIPALMVAPINLCGLLLMAHGLILRGLMVELFAKLLGTLLVARVFKLTKKQLLTFRWVVYVYDTVLRWLTWAHERVASTATYRRVKQLKEEMVRMIKRKS